MFFLTVSTSCIKFCAIPYNRSRGLSIPIFLEKTEQLYQLLATASIQVKVQLNMKVHEILHISSWGRGYKICVTHRRANRHTDSQKFFKNSQIVSGHRKTCKSIQNLKQKIFLIPIVSSFVQRKKQKKRSIEIKLEKD